MNVLVTGATGHIGSRLVPLLEAGGHAVRSVSRGPSGNYDWSDASLARGVREADAVIHLAGAGIFDHRWNARRKQLFYTSRIDTTRKVAKLCAERKPSVFVCASAIGWYGTSETATFDETSPHGSDFLADLCRDWEEATEAAVEAGVRTCRVRIGIVLDPSGGALAKMLPVFRLGIGGPLGSGRQWFSWVHVADLCAIFRFLVPTEIQTNADLFNTFRMSVRATRVEGDRRQTRAYYRWAPYVGATPASPRPLRVVPALPTPRACAASPECADFSTSTTSIATPVTPKPCAGLTALPASGFPVPNTVITLFFAVGFATALACLIVLVLRRSFQSAARRAVPERGARTILVRLRVHRDHPDDAARVVARLRAGEFANWKETGALDASLAIFRAGIVGLVLALAGVAFAALVAIAQRSSPNAANPPPILSRTTPELGRS
jgi:uncharacterized protein (TIGR01777 family)